MCAFICSFPFSRWAQARLLPCVRHGRGSAVPVLLMCLLIPFGCRCFFPLPPGGPEPSPPLRQTPPLQCKNFSGSSSKGRPRHTPTAPTPTGPTPPLSMHADVKPLKPNTVNGVSTVNGVNPVNGAQRGEGEAGP